MTLYPRSIGAFLGVLLDTLHAAHGARAVEADPWMVLRP